MKVLFLDVDGVLNSNAYRAYDDATKRLGMAPEHVAELHRIVVATGCKIVVSSMWRLGGIGPGSRFWEAMSAASPNSTILDAMIGSTPCKMSNYWRRNEILWWLRDNPEPERFAILDDEPAFILSGPDDPFAPNLFATDHYTGLTPEIADRVIAYLNGERHA